MKQLLLYKNSHLLAFFGALAVNVAAVAPSFMNFNPTVISQQTIQVSFVAPNGSKQQIKNPREEKIALDLKKENALKADKKNEKFSEEENKSVAGKQTSGRVDENSVATKAAESDPVFDAAYLNNPAPSYPALAKRRGKQGKVLLNVVVKTDGTALSVAVSRSSGSDELDEAALDAVKTWRFIPAKRHGESVQANVVVPVEFKII